MSEIDRILKCFHTEPRFRPVPSAMINLRHGVEIELDERSRPSEFETNACCPSCPSEGNVYATSTSSNAWNYPSLLISLVFVTFHDLLVPLGGTITGSLVRRSEEGWALFLAAGINHCSNLSLATSTCTSHCATSPFPSSAL